MADNTGYTVTASRTLPLLLATANVTVARAIALIRNANYRFIVLFFPLSLLYIRNRRSRAALRRVIASSGKSEEQRRTNSTSMHVSTEKQEFFEEPRRFPRSRVRNGVFVGCQRIPEAISAKSVRTISPNRLARLTAATRSEVSTRIRFSRSRS